MLRGKMPHFRLTSVAQKRLCLSSLLCRREAGEKEKESARGTTGRGTRVRETLAFFFFPSSSARFLFFDYCCHCWDTQREPRRRRAVRKVKMIAAIFSKRVSFELFFIARVQLHDVLSGIAYRLTFTASPYKTFVMSLSQVNMKKRERRTKHQDINAPL